MDKPIISVKNLSKKYVIGEKQQYYSLRDSISNVFKNPFKKEGNKRDEFWALKDVSFDVNEGDVVGIIGRNGAGKSTLLKILSQITPPTTGEIRLGGRVASLLEVGTGFHQELTGRENIYLNGAILGMKRREINKKFDEIVDFAEIEKFLDTPVKHYSSGMYMRLAFAVAAHLEPEILIVDEVLAVGDTQFQKKCLGKMSEVSKQGRTVLFVSHNMGAITQLCGKTILLDDGLLAKYGSTQKVVNSYVDRINGVSNTKQLSKTVFFDKVIINNGGVIKSGDKFVVSFRYNSKLNNILKNVRISTNIKNIKGDPMFICSTEMYYSKQLDLQKKGQIDLVIDRLPLSQGTYILDLFSEINGEVQDWIIDFAKIDVEAGKFFLGSRDVPLGWEGIGTLVPHSWNVI